MNLITCETVYHSFRSIPFIMPHVNGIAAKALPQLIDWMSKRALNCTEVLIYVEQTRFCNEAAYQLWSMPWKIHWLHALLLFHLVGSTYWKIYKVTGKKMSTQYTRHTKFVAIPVGAYTCTQSKSNDLGQSRVYQWGCVQEIVFVMN